MLIKPNRGSRRAGGVRAAPAPVPGPNLRGLRDPAGKTCTRIGSVDQVPVVVRTRSAPVRVDARPKGGKIVVVIGASGREES